MRNWLPRLCLVVGAASLCYVLGAAAMYFELPTSGFLEKSFAGARAWQERRRETSELPVVDRALGTAVVVDKPARTCDGFTLHTTNVGARAFLIDMRGQVVHEWSASFRKLWPAPPHVRDPVADERCYFFGCHLDGAGNLLAVMHGYPDTPYGYGLVKLDKNSEVVWTYSANAHHAVDVAANGTIYALTHQIARKPPAGLEFIPTPCLIDFLVTLAPDGKELKKVAILEALRDSPYAALLPIKTPHEDATWDAFHANSVMALPPSWAERFPLFQAGQVLVSLRALDALVVIDPATGKVIWAARGAWRRQHAPQFLDNGRLLIFDNLGSAWESRVLEYDPRTQAIPWSYSSEASPSFVTETQGDCQRLPNGNTLIVNSHDGKIHEVTADKMLVWSCSFACHVPWARRYAAAELNFLKGERHARP